MATNLLTFSAAGIRASAASADRRPDQTRRKTPPSSGKWWAPVFGWKSEPDYIGSGNKAEPEPKPARTGIAGGSFTEAKARRLRLMTMKTASFHDVMYHSAIASRLASDFDT